MSFYYGFLNFEAIEIKNSVDKLMIALSVAAVAAAYTALCTPTPPSTWKTFTVSFVYKRNHPDSVAAAQHMRSLFCTRFGMASCAVPSPPAVASGVRWVRDLDAEVMAGNITDVAFWATQNRLGIVHGAPGGYNVDVLIHPNTNCPATDATRRGLHVGHRTPYATSLLPRPPSAVASKSAFQSSSSSSASPPPPQSADDSIFVKCSSDATCTAPFANNTGCDRDEHQVAAHFHFYYVGSNPDVVAAVKAMVAATSERFPLPTDVCADNNGHEQPHNKSCWLSGPGSSGVLPPASNKTSPGGAYLSFLVHC